MSGAVERLVQEVIHFGHEIIDNLPHGHGAGHNRHGDDIRRMANEVDHAEVTVTAHIPIPYRPGSRFRLHNDGIPGLSPGAHISFGYPKPNGWTLGGFHRRNVGGPSGREIVDESSRKTLPHGVYRARWQLADAGGTVITKPNGRPLRKWSTFWPDDWTTADIESAIAEAYEDASWSLGGVYGKRFFGKAGPIPVEGYLDDSGKIVTAYPYFPEQ